MATIDRRPGRPKLWRARYRDPEGRQRTKSFRRKFDAEKFLVSVEHDILTGSFIDRDAGRITFKAFAEGWRRAQVHRASTGARVESVLRLHAYPVFGHRPIGSIRPSEIQTWVKGLTATLGASTVAVCHGIVASVFKSAVRDRRIPANPCEGSKLPAEVDDPVVPLATDQVVALESAMPARYRALVTLGAATGPRISEATGLTVDRSGLRPPSARPMLRIDRQLVVRSGLAPYLGPVKRKASKRDIPLPEAAGQALAAHLAAFAPVEQEIACEDEAGRRWSETVELVFTDERGRPLKRNRLSEVWRAAVKAAGLPETMTYHDLRHYYASLLIRHGESVKTVQARLGHATATETLDTYSHLWPDSEDRTRAAVDEVLGSARRVPDVSQAEG